MRFCGRSLARSSLRLENRTQNRVSPLRVARTKLARRVQVTLHTQIGPANLGPECEPGCKVTCTTRAGRSAHSVDSRPQMGGAIYTEKAGQLR